MKKSFLSASLFLISLALVLGSLESRAEVTIRVTNYLGSRVMIAFCWGGRTADQNRRAGWYYVLGYETKDIVLDADYSYTWDEFGYYATGGGKVWSANSSPGASAGRVIIDPDGPFKGHPKDRIDGGQEVHFKKIKLTPLKDPEDGVGAVSFN